MSYDFLNSLQPLILLNACVTSVIKQKAGFKRRDAQTGAITLIQRVSSAANLNIHLHCLVLDGVCRIQNGVAEFCTVHTPATEQLECIAP